MSERLVPFLPVADARARRRARARTAGTTIAPTRSVVCTASTATSGCWCARSPTCSATARDGLREVGERAVLNANYLAALVEGGLPAGIPDGRPMHEFVSTAQAAQGRTGIRAMDIAKRMIDLGFHPSTVYFPLVVEEAMMVEPTETESGSRSTRSPRPCSRSRARPRRPRPLARGSRDHAGPAPGRGASRPPAEAPLVARRGSLTSGSPCATRKSVARS